MNRDHTENEGISALLDNELSDAQLDAVLASLTAGADERQAWDIYHQIGDVLRSDDLALNLSPGFAAKMNALLDAEPAILAPQPAVNRISVGGKSHFARYTAMLSVAAMAVLAFMLVPQIAPYINGNGTATMQMIKTSDTLGNPVQLVADGGTAPVTESKNKAPDAIEMLRDPRLDSYLQAHQKFSPSIANASQFASHTTVNAVGNAAAPAASASSASFAQEK